MDLIVYSIYTPHCLFSPAVFTAPPQPLPPDLHGVADFRAAVTGIAHPIAIPICLHRVGDLGAVVQHVGDALQRGAKRDEIP